MKRRSFVVGVGLSVAAAAWPEWLRRAFADASLDSPRALSPSLAGAQARARHSGKPIFAIVVPARDDDKYERGRVWGEYLNHATPAQLAALALAEVVCAPLRRLPPSRDAVEGRTLAIVIEPDGEVRALDVALRDSPADGKEHDELARRRIAALAGMVQGALAADAKMLARRADDARRAIGADAAAIDRALADNRLTPALADRGAALVAAAASARHVALLASTVEAKLKKAPPPGAHWANTGGCALDSVEGMEETELIGIGCGMGQVPELSRRFLYFFTKTPGQRMHDEMFAHSDDKKRKP